MDFALSPNWHLETGLALNTTQYALEDLFGTGAAPKLRIVLGRFCLNWSFLLY
jgi:hypothetical protein